jgi:hypothetical protein
MYKRPSPGSDLGFSAFKGTIKLFLAIEAIGYRFD